jgi:ComF family protein
VRSTRPWRRLLPKTYPDAALAMRDLRDRAWQAGRALLDLLYPPRCPGCGQLGPVFCERCQGQVELIAPPVCLRCGCPVLQDGLCSRCRPIPSSLDGVVAAALFAGPLRQAVHALKYENVTSLAAPLASIMARAWRWGDLPPPQLILPVPLHTRRQAERGFNQSVLLARGLGRDVGVPVDEGILVRQRATRPQVGLDQSARHQNVEGAFACRGPVAGKTLAVVDDVCTTGATLEACADALKAAGAAGVWGFTLARARWGADLTGVTGNPL